MAALSVFSMESGFQHLVQDQKMIRKAGVSMEDSELIARIRQGERRLFETLTEKYYQDIFRFCYYKTGNESAAYDCTQDTFLRLVQYFDSYVDQKKFKSYLFRIASNTCHDHFRSQSAVCISQEEMLEIPEESQGWKQIETSQPVQQALNRLPDMQKEVIILYFYHGFKVREIAGITGVGIPTAKSRLKQGLDKLRKQLRKEDFE